MQIWDYSMKMDGKVNPQEGFRVVQTSTQLADAKGNKSDPPKSRDSKITWHPPCLAQ